MEPETKNCEIIVSASVFSRLSGFPENFLVSGSSNRSLVPIVFVLPLFSPTWAANTSESMLLNNCQYFFSAPLVPTCFQDTNSSCAHCCYLMTDGGAGTLYFLKSVETKTKTRHQSWFLCFIRVIFFFWRSATLLQEVTPCVRKLSSCAASLRKSELLPALDSLLKIPTRWLWCSTQNCKTNIMLEQNVETQFCLFIDSFLSGFQMCKISTFYKTKILHIFLCGAKKSMFCHHMVKDSDGVLWVSLLHLSHNSLFRAIIMVILDHTPVSFERGPSLRKILQFLNI